MENIVGSDSAAAIKACSAAAAGPLRRDGLTGAVQDVFWDDAGQAPAVQFCARLTNPDEKDACYQSITARASELALRSPESSSARSMSPHS